MRKTYLLLISVFLFQMFPSMAQPNVGMQADVVTATPSATIDVPMRVTDFWNVVTCNGTIVWDTSVVKFNSVPFMGLPYMTNATFDTSQAWKGVLSFNWMHLISIGSTLPDGDIMFTVRYNAVGASGTSTSIGFSNVPTPLYWYNFAAWSGTIDTSSGSVSIMCSPANLPIASYSQSGGGMMFNFVSTSFNSPTAWLWDFGDGDTASVANPQHTYATVDTFTVCLTVWNACGQDSVCGQVVASTPTGIPWVDPLDEITIFPMPARDVINLTMGSSNNEELFVQIFDLQGRWLLNQTLKSRAHYTVLVGHLSSGFYLMKVSSRKNTKSIPLVIE